MGVVLSLPPVIRGRGAPYLPTFRRGLESMFRDVRMQPSIAKGLENGAHLSFVDLGSGDGRVVFRAAREKIFRKCIGFEINPVLHAWASCRRLIQAPKYWSTTQFGLCDLWKVDLGDIDCVAIYGLQPIMKDLGAKMQAEMKPGAIVVSNVFTIPGWKPAVSSAEGVHIYRVPECWE
uniref:Methyltransferase domain-containing protein n=1 Tax=Trieres chinensis TaxID=1514140 RepID=A0A7S2EMH4_TRICV